MRLARDFGTIRELYPAGVDDLRELPYAWFDAIQKSLQFLSFEEMDPEERPRRSIWLDDEAMSAHFEWLAAHRKEKWGNPDESIEDPVQNEAAESLIVG